MTAVSTERWSDRRYQKQVSAMRVFDVAFASSEEDALAAVAGQQAVYRNAQHPLDPQLRVRTDGMQISQPGFGLYRAQASYAAGTFNDQNDKTLEAPTWQWLPESVTEQISADIRGNLITNSAGDLPTQSATRWTVRHAIVIARYEKGFPIDRVNRYTNAVNSDTFAINGYIIEPGQAFMKSITQVQEAKLSALFVRVRYVIAFHPGFSKDAYGVWDGFQLRMPDKGKRAWFADNSPEGASPQQIYLPSPDTGTYDRVTEDVVLNGYGATYSGKFTSKNGAKSVANPNWPPQSGPTLYVPPNGYGVVLVWDNYKTAPFGNLGIFF